MKPEAARPPEAVALPHLRPGQLLLVYTPDGPVGGTFTCTSCKAQAWQPDLLVHAGVCAFRAALPSSDPRAR